MLTRREFPSFSHPLLPKISLSVAVIEVLWSTTSRRIGVNLDKPICPSRQGSRVSCLGDGEASCVLRYFSGHLPLLNKTELCVTVAESSG